MKKVRSRTIAYKSGWLISKSKGLGLGSHDGGFNRGEGMGDALTGVGSAPGPIYDSFRRNGRHRRCALYRHFTDLNN